MSASTLQPSRVHQALRRSPFPAVRKLSLEESETQVVILGQVDSYYMKQLAQEAVKPELGQRRLLNQVQVISVQ